MNSSKKNLFACEATRTRVFRVLCEAIRSDAKLSVNVLVYFACDAKRYEAMRRVRIVFSCILHEMFVSFINNVIFQAKLLKKICCMTAQQKCIVANPIVSK